MNRILGFFFTIILLFTSFAFADTSKYINNYGQLPRYRSLAISPDGKHISYIERGPDYDMFIVKDIETKETIFAGKITDFKARSTSFVTNKHVLFLGSDTILAWGALTSHEQSGALVYNIETGRFYPLLQGIKDIYPAQTGLGSIVGLNAEDESVYMPAFASLSTPKLNLYRVSLNTGMGTIHARGSQHTVDWFVGKQGKILAKEEYNKNRKIHTIRSELTGEWVTVYSKETPVPEISVRAVGVDEKSLLYIDEKDDRKALYSMSLLDGSVSGPLYSNEDADIDGLVLDTNHKLMAVIYSGFKPRYEFVDSDFNRILSSVESSFPSSSIHLRSWTDDKKSVILLVSGGDASGVYYLLDCEKLKMSRLASQYDVPAIGEIKAIRYKARDGLNIPAILTLPPGNQEKKNLPLIVLPHGGPAAYDQIDFDWMVQYFALKGYAVLQPNFRGSTGFGYAFRNAGSGRWGREMQDDVSDGIATLVKTGYVDPNRVSIVGASYGGYSALVGGAFSPELYRCVISVNGVSDLPKMLKSEKFRYGPNHWVINYWQSIIGDSKSEIDKLRSISPVNFAVDFEAPVLLIHGKDDTVVPLEQSKIMHKALKKAGKTTKLITIKGEDHWLSTSSTRLQILKAIDDFLNTHNPTNDMTE